MALDSKFQMVRFQMDKYKKITLILLILLTNETLMFVGTGLAGGSASATLAELGYNVKSFLFPRFTASRALYCGTRWN
jgi:succinate dehydrogenase / fumarate reductase flavoprotein subunit